MSFVTLEFSQKHHEVLQNELQQTNRNSYADLSSDLQVVFEDVVPTERVNRGRTACLQHTHVVFNAPTLDDCCV